MIHDHGSLLRARPNLLFRVREWQDGASWEEFYRLYRRLVYGRARRAGLDHSAAEDVAHDVFKRVAETIADFDTDPERGSFRGWLIQLTHRRIAENLGSKRRLPNPGPAPAPVEQVPAPVTDEDEWDREWQQHVLSMALERLARQVKPRHFQVFELYVRQGWSVLNVSLHLGINPASVYVVGHRFTKLLEIEVTKLRSQLG